MAATSSRMSAILPGVTARVMSTEPQGQATVPHSVPLTRRSRPCDAVEAQADGAALPFRRDHRLALVPGAHHQRSVVEVPLRAAAEGQEIGTPARVNLPVAWHLEISPAQLRRIRRACCAWVS